MLYLTSQIKTAIVLTTCLALAACGSPDKESTEAKQKLMEKTETNISTTTNQSNIFSKNPDALHLKVSTEFSYPPYVKQDEHGILEGLEIELLSQIAKEQDLTLTFHPDYWRDVVKKVTKGYTTVAMSGVNKLPELDEEMVATIPYTTDRLKVYSMKRDGLNNLADFEGKVVGMQANTHAPPQDLLDTAKEVKMFDTSFLLLHALATGKIDGFLNNGNVTESVLKDFPSIEISQFNYDDVEIPIVFYVNKDDKEALKSLNKGIKNLKDSGSLDEILAKW